MLPTNTNNFSYLFLFGFLTNILYNIPWSCIFLFLKPLGIHMYNIKKKEECNTIQKNIGTCSQITDGGKAFGYSIGYWYLAYVSSSDYDTTNVWLICCVSTYERLSKEKEISVTFFKDKTKPNEISDYKVTKPFTIVERHGTSSSIYYRSRSLKLSITPRYNQQVIINDIIQLLNTKKSAVVLLHGPPNIGKTMLSLILANNLNGNYCNNLSPWEPGDSLTSLYGDVEVSEKTPLIIAFDEIDSAIVQIHEGIPTHKDVKIKIRNKAGWNKMFDEIQKGLYPNLIVVMTTNKNPEYFNKLDSSYLAPHRVDKIYELRDTEDLFTQ